MQSRSIAVIAGLAAAVVIFVIAVAVRQAKAPRVISSERAASSSSSQVRTVRGKSGSENAAGDAGKRRGKPGAANQELTPANTPPGQTPISTLPSERATTAGLVGRDGTIPGGPGTAGAAAGHGKNPANGVGTTGSGAPSADGLKPGATDSAASEGDASGQAAAGGASATPNPEATLAPGMAIIGGQVLHGEVRISDASLTLIGEGSNLRAGTDENGRYQFDPVSPGTYRLTLEKPKAPSSVRYVVLKADEMRTNEDFIIPVGHEIEGIVVGETSGNGVAGARVVINNASEKYLFEVRTASDGAFKTASTEAGDYVLYVEASGYISKKSTITVPEDLSEAMQPVKIELEEANTIRGKVMDAAGGPASQAMVGLFTVQASSAFSDPFASIAPVITDSSGAYVISNVPTVQTTFRVGVWKGQHAPVFSSVLQMPEAFQQDVPTITIGTGVAAKGRVVDSKSEPIDGVLVTLPSSDSFPNTGVILQRFNAELPRATTSADGSFRVVGLESGSIELDFSATDYLRQKKTIQATPPEVDIGDVVLQLEDEAGPGVLTGQIIDELGVRYARANCTLFCSNCSPPYTSFQTTDELGHFIFRELPDGNYRLEIATSTLRVGGLWIVLNQRLTGLKPGGGMFYVTFDLSGQVKIKVQDASGQPMRRFRVAVQSNSGQLQDSAYNSITASYETTFESADGEALLQNLVAGTVQITVTVEGVGVAELKNVVVPLEGVNDAGVVQVGQGASMSGRVVAAESGAGIEGAKVLAIPPASAPSDHILNQLNRYTVTASDGRFTLSPLPAGALRLKVTASERVEKIFEGFEAVEAETRPTGDLSIEEGGIVTGRVLDAGGNPAAAIGVRVGSVYAVSDPMGQYRLEGVAPGPQILQAAATASSTTVKVPIEVVAGQVLQVDVHLP